MVFVTVRLEIWKFCKRFRDRSTSKPESINKRASKLKYRLSRRRCHQFQFLTSNLQKIETVLWVIGGGGDCGGDAFLKQMYVRMICVYRIH